tara:strand:+ start:692 stop:940 length:249 start_codon:yes stop_codon:yes gene_type:complete
MGGRWCESFTGEAVLGIVTNLAATFGQVTYTAATQVRVLGNAAYVCPVVPAALALGMPTGAHRNLQAFKLGAFGIGGIRQRR